LLHIIGVIGEKNIDMAEFFILIAFVLGTIIGSFLNAYTFRYNTGLSMMTRSKCMSCSTEIAWYDLIPGVSFLILRGRCRACSSRFSMQYPLIEILTGVLFAGAFWVLGLTLETLLVGIIFSLLVAILIYDMRHKIIPNTFVYWFTLLAFISNFLTGNTFSSVFWDYSVLITGIGLYLFFAAFWFFSKGKWMGLGDAKLALGMGLFLGPVAGVSAVILGFWIGALVGLGLLGVQKIQNRMGLSMKSEIPFAPFLILGLWVVFFFQVNVFNFTL